MAFGVKTNERPGTRAVLRYQRVSAYKAREVLDLIRGNHVDEADEILQFTDRAVAQPIRKLLASAIANAETNDSQDPETLYVSACYADEGPTLKRWRPRARGRATRIRKRTCHITIIVSRLSDEQLRIRAEQETARAARGGGRRPTRRAAEARRRRVERSRRRDAERAGLETEGETAEAEVAEGAETEAGVEAEPDTAEPDTAEAEDVEAEPETAEAEVVEGDETDASEEDASELPEGEPRDENEEN